LPDPTQRYLRTGDYALFGQTDWKVRPNLTLNLGLRWEYYTPITEKQGKLTQLDLGPIGAPNPVIRVVSELAPPDRNNFAPRIGFAWSPQKFNTKMVWRGGVGVFYNRFEGAAFGPMRENPPFHAAFGFCCGVSRVDNPSDPNAPFLDGIILYQLGATNSPLSFAGNPKLAVGVDPATNFPLSCQSLPVGCNVQVYSTPPKMPSPYTYVYSLETEYELAARTTFTLGYAGSFGRKQLRIYDLNQVRADMKCFLEDMGLDPVLSETPAFPVSPQTSPLENCLQAVKERADILVLIVGARYGSQNESGKSVTNLEYIEAKAKGIPVYAFVLKQLLNVLPVWKKNPQGNYDGTVDTPKLFEFVETLRTSQDHWVFEFEEAQHIMDILRRQLAYLFMDGLILREKVKGLKLPPTLRNLPGTALKIVLERPIGWEYRFFSAVLSDEMDSDQELKWDLEYGLKIGRIHPLREPWLMINWLQQKMNEIGALVDSASRLMNEAIQDALGNPGVAGDPEHLVYCARRIAQIRKELVKWTIEFRCTEVQPECEHLLSLISEMSKDVIEKLESIPAKLDAEITKALEAHARGQKYTAELMLSLTIPNNDEIAAEFAKLSQTLR